MTQKEWKHIVLKYEKGEPLLITEVKSNLQQNEKCTKIHQFHKEMQPILLRQCITGLVKILTPRKSNGQIKRAYHVDFKGIGYQ
uniref:Uncharacterized protein n=1 Tax=Arundo donax TaxID=35708 RepID=A0A0A9FE79_ARUDO